MSTFLVSLFVLRTHHIYTGLCSFGCDVLLPLLISAYLPFSLVLGFKFNPMGLKTKKMLTTYECLDLSDPYLSKLT